MPKGSKGQSQHACQSHRKLDEGGAPGTGDRSRKKEMDAKPFYGDFLEHAGSVGEMHLSELARPVLWVPIVRLWPIADVRTCLSIRPLSGVKRTCRRHARIFRV